MVNHLYIHIPFCQRRCSYCDFNTYANMEDRIEAYVQALCAELGMLSLSEKESEREAPGECQALPSNPTHFLQSTIFFGGGTPSMLTLEQMERILVAAGALVPLEGAEITVEANPGAVLGADTPALAYLRGLRALGVNRLSMGVQSLHDPTLRILGRIHTAADARRCYATARQAGFDNINLDFIFGLPGQTIAQWEATLAEIVTWGVDHFALYSLILEERTPLYAQVTSGRVAAPDDDEAAAMYEAAMDRFAAAGYAQYEISNWARAENREQGTGNREQGTGDREQGTENREQGTENREQRTGNREQGTGNREQGKAGDDTVLCSLFSVPSLACRHNLAYWLNRDYLAAGAGAHGHRYPRRYANILGVDEYIRAVGAGRLPVAEEIALTHRDLCAETMFMGLRLNAGVGYGHFRARCGVEMGEVFGETLADLERLGLLERDAAGVRLTPRGRMLGNQVFERFV